MNHGRKQLVYKEMERVKDKSEKHEHIPSFATSLIKYLLYARLKRYKEGEHNKQTLILHNE